MEKSLRGIYRNGQVELLEEPEGVEKARVLVVFLDSDGESPERRIRSVLAEQRKTILALAEKHHAGNVRVFGSAARGDAEPGSDVDFLVEMEPGWTPFDLTRLQRALRDLLDCSVDVVREEALSPRAREQVLREAVPV